MQVQSYCFHSASIKSAFGYNEVAKETDFQGKDWKSDLL